MRGSLAAGRYVGFLVVSVAVLAIAGGYAFSKVFHTLSIGVGRDTTFRREGADSFAVKDPRAIRPGRSEYQLYAQEDSAWRQRYAPPVSWQSMSPLAGVPWHPSPRQALTDSVYRLTKAGQNGPAIALMERWLDVHRDDYVLTVELARLLNTAGQSAAAVARYRSALAMRPDRAVRAELAQLLLDAQQYGPAVAEYRTLLQLEPQNGPYRLGLARALAWGDHPREAERELASLHARAPGDTAVAHLLVTVRAAYEPSADEARRWVAAEPAYEPYRLALARALVAEKRYAAAIAEYDTLMGRKPTLAMLREAAGAHAVAGDSVGTARLYALAVEAAPKDDSLRLDYAKALAWSGDQQGAIEQYSVLILNRPSADLLLTRGQLYVWKGDNALGARDLEESVKMEPSYDAYALLGDVNRWQGNWKVSRAMYARALALRPDDSRVLLAVADVTRLERMGAGAGAGTPIGAPEVGWAIHSGYAQDNAGYAFASAGVQRGVTVAPGTVLSVNAEQRRVAQRYFDRPEQYAYGYAADLTGSQRFGSHFSASLTGGEAKYALIKAIPYGSLGLDWFGRRGSVSAQIGTGPLYESLMSLRTLLPASGALAFSANPISSLTGTTTTGTVTVPLGAVQATLKGEHVRLSDGNARTAFTGDLRLPIVKGLNALYSGSTLGYAQASTLYWDPARYTSHSFGLEASAQPTDGLYLDLRALPGIARSEQAVTLTSGLAAADATGTRLTIPPRNVFQFTTSGDLTYRAPRWELTGGLGYGRGRAGSYQSVNGTMRLSFTW